jgi:hypothetical protein
LHSGEHRKRELAASSLWPVREETTDPAEHGLSLLLWHDKHSRLGGKGRNERLSRALLAVRELQQRLGIELGDRAQARKVCVGWPGTPAAALPLTC